MHLALLQSAISTNDVRAFAVYVGDAVAIGTFGFLWKLNARVARIETILLEKSTGIVPRLDGTSKQSYANDKAIEGHEVRLNNHDREIERLDRDKEPRRLQPTDVGTLDRRSSK